MPFSIIEPKMQSISVAQASKQSKTIRTTDTSVMDMSGYLDELHEIECVNQLRQELRRCGRLQVAHSFNF